MVDTRRVLPDSCCGCNERAGSRRNESLIFHDPRVAGNLREPLRRMDSCSSETT